MSISFYVTTVSTSFIVISAIFVAIGWSLIRKRKIESHQKAMFFAGLFATSFFIVYLSRTLILGNTAFGGPDSIKPFYTVFLIFHIILAATGGVLGIISLWSGYKKRFDRHRKIGPTASVVWFATAITGVTVYSLLYLVFPGGDTTNVFRAIFGF